MLDTDFKTHDYTDRKWGHDFGVHEVIDQGRKLKLFGWGKRILPGDYLILPNGVHTTRYQVEDIIYENNPPDMWWATVNFSPRENKNA